MKTKIISGFPAVGKSHFYNKNKEISIDSDSSKFSKSLDGEKNPFFPENYIDHIKDNMGRYEYILVSSHKEVRDALRIARINYTLVYPDRILLDEYVRRFYIRGNTMAFVEFIKENWNKFMDEMEAEKFPNKIVLGNEQYLSDLV